MAMGLPELFIIILIIITSIILILYNRIKIEPIKEQIDIEKDELRSRQAKLKMFIEKLDKKLTSGEIDNEYHKELTEKYNAEYRNLKNQLVEKELLHDTGFEIKREDIKISHDDDENKGSIDSAIFWMFFLSILLFWLPVIGFLLAGFIGGRKAGGIVEAILAALIPTIIFFLLSTTILSSWLSDLLGPIIGILFGTVFGGVIGIYVLIHSMALIAGAIIGALTVEK